MTSTMNKKPRRTLKLRISTLEMPPVKFRDAIDQRVRSEHPEFEFNWIESNKNNLMFEAPDPTIIAAIVGASAVVLTSFIETAVKVVLEGRKEAANKPAQIQIIVRAGSGDETTHMIVDGERFSLPDSYLSEAESEVEVTL